MHVPFETAARVGTHAPPEIHVSLAAGRAATRVTELGPGPNYRESGRVCSLSSLARKKEIFRGAIHTCGGMCESPSGGLERGWVY